MASFYFEISRNESKKFLTRLLCTISQGERKIFENTFENVRTLWRTGCRGFSHFRVKAPKRAFENYDMSITFTCVFRHLRRMFCVYFFILTTRLPSGFCVSCKVLSLLFACRYYYKSDVVFVRRTLPSFLKQEKNVNISK